MISYVGEGGIVKDALITTTTGEKMMKIHLLLLT